MGLFIMKQLLMISPGFLLFVRKAIVAAIALHTAFFILFLFLSVPVLMVTHIGSVILFAAALWLLRSHSFKSITALFWIDLIGHTLISSEVISWQSGFHFYLYLLIPMVFLYIQGTQTRKIVLVESIVVIYLLLDYYSLGREPIVELSSTVVISLHYINLILSFIGLSALIHMYQTLLQDSEPCRQSAAADQLTGLYNRHAILTKIDEILTSSNHAHQPMALIIADVDRFRWLTDVYGQSTADNILVHIAQILHESIRHNDRASRWRGSEFLILLPGGSLASAEHIAQRVQHKLLESPMHFPEKSCAITLTLGVAELLPDEDFNQCLIRADLALQRGKKAGGDRIELAQPEITSDKSGE